MVFTCVSIAAFFQLRDQAAHLHSAHDIRLKELLIAVGVVHQCTVVYNGVYLAAQLLVDALLQAQVRLRQVTWQQTTSMSGLEQACLALSSLTAILLDKPAGSTAAPCRACRQRC